MLVALVLGRLLQQQPGRRAAQLLAGLADRGERHGGRSCELDVVLADDREVFRHPDAMAGHLLQHAQGDQDPRYRRMPCSVAGSTVV